MDHKLKPTGGSVYRFGIRTLLIALSVAAVLPGLLTGGVILYRYWRDVEENTQALTLEVSRAYALDIDARIADIEASLVMLASLNELRDENFGAFSRPAAEALEVVRGRWIRLIDANGSAIFITRRPSQSPGREQDNTEPPTRPVEIERGAVLYISPPSPGNDRNVVIGIPVTTAPGEKHRLEVAVPAERFEEVLREGNLPDGGIAILLDRSGTLIARFPPSPNRTMRRGESDLAATMRPDAETGFSHANFDGVPLNGTFTRSKLSGWAVGVGVATDIIEAPYRRSLALLGAVGAFLTLVSAILAWYLARHVTRAISSLSMAADALGRGAEPPMLVRGFREIAHTGTRLWEAAELLKRRATERDNAFDALRNVNESLEQRIDARTMELANVNRRLSQEMEHRRDAEEALGQRRKMEAIGQLTAGIAHDFNNLLTPIIGNIELIRSGAADPRTERLCLGALRAAEHGASLTKQLLAFGRRQRLENRVVDVNSLIANLMPLFRQAAGPLVQLSTRLADGNWAIMVDRVQLEAALLNLAANARDAMPDGGSLTIATNWLRAVQDHPHIAPGEWAAISVMDDGAGMTPEILARVFEPFYTTKPAGAGSGLGLSMVYGLVKQLGGEVGIESAPGKGTTVTIYLPRVVASPLAATAASTAAQPDLSGTRILLVDDNPEVLNSMAALLEEAGCHVTLAESGWIAIARFEAAPDVDLIIIDYAMPGMSGTATAGALRARRPDLLILLATGLADAIEPGGWPEDCILHKPFRPIELLNAVHNTIGRARDQ